LKNEYFGSHRHSVLVIVGKRFNGTSMSNLRLGINYGALRATTVINSP
jgi:hypothetical protein